MYHFYLYYSNDKNPYSEHQPSESVGLQDMGDPAVRPVKLSVTKVSTDIQQDVILKVMFYGDTLSCTSIYGNVEMFYKWHLNDMLK